MIQISLAEYARGPAEAFKQERSYEAMRGLGANLLVSDRAC